MGISLPHLYISTSLLAEGGLSIRPHDDIKPTFVRQWLTILPEDSAGTLLAAAG